MFSREKKQTGFYKDPAHSRTEVSAPDALEEEYQVCEALSRQGGAPGAGVPCLAAREGLEGRDGAGCATDQIGLVGLDSVRRLVGVGW